MIEESKNICRVCLHVSKLKCPSLFEQYNDRLIADKINSITNVGIYEGDGLPNRICPDCLIELENAVSFKLKCEESNVVLRTTDVKEEDDFEYELVRLEDNHQDNEQQEDDHRSQAQFSDSSLQNSEVISQNGDRLTLVKIKEEDDLEHKNELPDYKAIQKEVGHHKDDLPSQELISDIEFEKPSQSLPKSRAIDLKLECHDCGGFFKSKCKLRVHRKKAHKLKLICEICKRLFKSYNAYHLHCKNRKTTCLNVSNVRIEGEGKSRIHHCKECEYKAKHLYKMKIHLLTHSGERPHKCDKCTRCFTQLSSLQGHKEVAHNEYKVVATCQYCGKFLQGRSRVYKHMLTHRPKSFQCDICKKFLRNKECLKEHINRHMGIRPYTCEICASTYHTLSDLSNHKLTHNRSLSCECDICGYKARRISTIKIHKAKHTATNHPCLTCGKFVETTQLLKVHMKRHLDRSYTCTFCDMKFHNRQSRSSHVRKKHKYTMLGNYKTKTPNMKDKSPKEKS